MTTAPERFYDFIGFGDEVPGILTLVSAAREHFRRTGRYPKTLLILTGDSQQGIGGHLVRGGLAYLDRSNIPLSIRQSLGLGTYGVSSALYQEFLQKAGVVQVALDPRKADTVLRQMLRDAQIDTLSRVEIGSVFKEGGKLTGIQLTKGEIYRGQQFVDATVNAELAQAAGVSKLPGFGVLGLSKSELPVTLVFETEGLSVDRLRRIEAEYLKRLNNPTDQEAQQFLNIATYGDTALATQLRRDLVDASGKPKPMWVGSDYIDVRTKALSIAYHAFRGTKLSLEESPAILDNGNVAILSGGRLSWNALLHATTGSEAEALARSNAKPTALMLEEMTFVKQWFKSIGASEVRSAPELYIRHAGNIVGAVDPLSGADMLFGGVPDKEACGTFGYPFDIRGGITGLGSIAASKGFNRTHFKPPLFNIGMRHALLKTVPNLAVVSPAADFQGIAAATGRIVEFNVAVGQAVGIAMAIAQLTNRNLSEISNTEVRSVLAQTKRLPKLYGRADAIEAARLRDFEQQIIA